MKKLFVLPSFERSIKDFTPQQKELLAKSLESLNQYLQTGKSTYGFRFKKIDHDKFECRIGIRLRIILRKDAEGYYLVLAGDHNDVRRHLRGNR